MKKRFSNTQTLIPTSPTNWYPTIVALGPDLSPDAATHKTILGQPNGNSFDPHPNRNGDNKIIRLHLTYSTSGALRRCYFGYCLLFIDTWQCEDIHIEFTHTLLCVVGLESLANKRYFVHSCVSHLLRPSKDGFKDYFFPSCIVSFMGCFLYLKSEKTWNFHLLHTSVKCTNNSIYIVVVPKVRSFVFSR